MDDSGASSAPVPVRRNPRGGIGWGPRRLDADGSCPLDRPYPIEPGRGVVEHGVVAAFLTGLDSPWNDWDSQCGMSSESHFPEKPSSQRRCACS